MGGATSIFAAVRAIVSRVQFGGKESNTQKGRKMLFISDKNNKTIKQWNAGTSWWGIENIEDVEIVQADGHELDYISTHFENLPIARNVRVQVWRGDMARFIAENLV